MIKTWILSAGLIAGSAFLAIAADAPKYTTKEVMKALHKGDDAVAKKVSKGEGTAADFDLLVLYYTALPLNEPPKGDAKSWQDKTVALLEAAKALKAGKAGALDQYKAAVNCKACHSVHKAD